MAMPATLPTDPSAPHSALGAPRGAEALYGELTQMIERLHRRFLDVVRLELDRLEVGDINAVQALLVANLTEEVTMGDLMRRAYYLGSSVSYNVKKLVESGYLVQERSDRDRRSIRVRLTEKGEILADALRAAQLRQAETLIDAEEHAPNLETTARTLHRLEQAWSDYVQFGHLGRM